jgi:hypothetical protein
VGVGVDEHRSRECRLSLDSQERGEIGHPPMARFSCFHFHLWPTSSSFQTAASSVI